MSISRGKHFIERAQLPLTPSDQDLIDRFHDLYYRRWQAGADTINLSWFGYLTLKCPLDLWIYQELLVKHPTDFVIETGTHRGGSALFLAMILDHIGIGRIITIDIKKGVDLPSHPRIDYLVGSSVDPAIVSEIKTRVAGAPAMVILDSDHKAEHVLAEIEAYRSLLQVGDYLIVEDTNVNGHPTFPEYGPGPMEAVDQFLAGNDEFAIDERCERFLMTLNPRGYLRRVKQAPQPAVRPGKSPDAGPG